MSEENPKVHRLNDSDEGPVRRRGIYFLPNLITTGALCAGVYATVAGFNGRYVAAAFAIFAAMALDAADGRVARFTRTESSFGAEYDSLSDMVAFGVAPALLVFSWGLSALGQIGWVVTFVYVACTALRLARYNVKGDNETFTGLASPAAAAVLACAIWVWEETIPGVEPSLLAASTMGVVTTLVALLMVSNFTYFSPKLLNIRNRVPFVALVLVVLGFAVLLASPPHVLVTLAMLYALSGPVQWVWGVHRSNSNSDQKKEP
ncbi:MAG: CDP-diacylglycerol--serine O-phosphatidyltransferase [Pseudomonadales bacterium]|jgi:CDP-diacylglycerol--serine O-phosphatidyltransferase|nr:CDP-diacylglycerol--serine O-phosphatidyltransferase [Pseudomonadales bacterium]MDP6471594.1 CDP-diacylglycerol--serine O-phosphatidyltransferase [Pseudomonadales bacterium]MDP6828857.1 CDP-diacylglycerol--serine O-phosphatidyltransferase [Pseudomonadales bacterium]MDP6970615.1 CDP-diacylglycerol--serine O-phosphatidyltransferase [Pseudomonadales bacterium]|tara:strand:+ start:513 stop:1298 length:786 start_codon:yes stop_codon:yes gene_type:complete